MGVGVVTTDGVGVGVIVGKTMRVADGEGVPEGISVGVGSELGVDTARAGSAPTHLRYPTIQSLAKIALPAESVIVPCKSMCESCFQAIFDSCTNKPA